MFYDSITSPDLREEQKSRKWFAFFFCSRLQIKYKKKISTLKAQVQAQVQTQIQAQAQA